jgi:hypothetical protein
MAENTEATALKGRRAAATKTAAETPDPGGNLTGETRAPQIGVNEPARNYFMLGDPNEPRAVIEASGGMYGEIIGDDYVIAPEDAVEEVTPSGCTTSTSRLRWARGQHVPIEVFRKHYGPERAAELLKPAAVVVAEEVPAP